jgi:hypothetical protein
MHALVSRRPALVNRDHFRTLRCPLGDGRFRGTSGSEPRTSGPSVAEYSLSWQPAGSRPLKRPAGRAAEIVAIEARKETAAWEAAEARSPRFRPAAARAIRKASRPDRNASGGRKRTVRRGARLHRRRAGVQGVDCRSSAEV